jgi:hypothetical protein
MKLSFSTLGCPAWSYQDILRRAAEYGFDGVAIDVKDSREDFATRLAPK